MEQIIVMTIKPCHLHDMRIGKKDIELRKTFPALVDFPFTVALCESGSGGKVMAEFTCDECYNIKRTDSRERLMTFAKRACVSVIDLVGYMDGGLVRGWHVQDFIDFTRANGHDIMHISDYGLDRPPQSWCYAKKVTV